MTEKKNCYLTIQSLQTHLVFEPDSATVIAWQRAENGDFERVKHTGLEVIIPLPAIHGELLLSDVYRDIPEA